MKKLLSGVAAMTLAVAPASAATLVADEVIEFFDSGAGPQAGPYGGGGGISGNGAVPLSYAVDGDSATYVSLPTGSFIIVKFNGGFVFDGAGNDLFIGEIGNGQEDALIEVSTNGVDFTEIGTAFGNQVSEFDLNGLFADPVFFVKITGIDNGGSVPGFDLTFVEGLEGSVGEVPVPAAALLFGTALAGFAGRKKLARS